MIFTERTIMVVNDRAKINKPLILYRGDKNIELKITIVESQFKFRSTGASNVIETTDASYAQLVINTPYNSPIFSEVTATENGAVIFVISEAMIDEIREVGIYDIQIRLFDDSKQSRVTIPPVNNAIEIREPIAKEDSNNNITNSAIVGSAVVTNDLEIPTFVGGSYNKKAWNDGDVISKQKLNKMEDGIYETYELSKDNSSQIKDIDTRIDNLENSSGGGMTPDSTNNVILLVTQAQYNSLIAGETVTIDGVQHTYDENMIYGITDATESGTFNGILTSPNGTEYILTVDNNGNLSTTLKPVLCTGVSLDTNSLTFETNATQTLHATFTPSNTTENKVWSSDSPSIARVANGVVTPVSNGSCNITITCGSFSATCSVTVNMSGESGGSGGSESPVDPQNFVNYAYNTDTYTNPTTTDLVNKKTYYTIGYLNKSVNDGVLTLTKKEGTSKGYTLFKLGIGDNNTYYYRALIRTSSPGVKAGVNGGTSPVAADNEWHLVSYVAVDTSASSKGYAIDLDVNVVNGPVELKELMKINLTEVYGAGNEPDKATCDATFTTYKTGLIG